MIKNFLQMIFGMGSQDLGVKYIEEFHKRKIETMNKNDILTALENAAINGSGNDNESRLDFVGKLIKGDLALKISKEERLEIFKKAALKIDEDSSNIKKNQVEDENN